MNFQSFKEVADFCQRMASETRRRFRKIALLGVVGASVWSAIAIFVSRSWLLSGILGFVAGAQSIVAWSAWRRGETFFHEWMGHRQIALEQAEHYSE